MSLKVCNLVVIEFQSLTRGGYKGRYNMKSTPLYIKNLLQPSAKSPTSRKVWSVDLENVWLPFLTATNTMGDTAIPSDALGSPIRLAYDKDGSVKFSKTGRVVTKVVKPIADSVTLIRQNFVANLQNYAEQVANDEKEGYANQVRKAHVAGQPIIAHDKEELDKAIQLQIAEAIAQAELEAEQPVPEAEQPVPEKELVTAQ